MFPGVYTLAYPMIARKATRQIPGTEWNLSKHVCRDTAGVAGSAGRSDDALRGEAAEPAVQGGISDGLFSDLMSERIPVVVGWEFHRVLVLGKMLNKPRLQVQDLEPTLPGLLHKIAPHDIEVGPGGMFQPGGVIEVWAHAIQRKQGSKQDADKGERRPSHQGDWREGQGRDAPAGSSARWMVDRRVGSSRVI